MSQNKEGYVDDINMFPFQSRLSMAFLSRLSHWPAISAYEFLFSAKNCKPHNQID